ncbi:MAG: methylated-DNA--[protein]-cysteine S-methyltransferase, partial [Nitrospiraceae bacterium]|nr:methylated-DNA--[protein]-cysteine S-methyltransferase [Nitrospiraceae bacterium]
RAVANAIGKNPLPILLPCHRVIRKNGALGGFSSGLEMKKTLLKIEKAVFPLKEAACRA